MSFYQRILKIRTSNCVKPRLHSVDDLKLKIARKIQNDTLRQVKSSLFCIYTPQLVCRYNTENKKIKGLNLRKRTSSNNFERTAEWNFESKRQVRSGNEIVDYSRAPCLGANQKTRGIWERDCGSPIFFYNEYVYRVGRPGVLLIMKITISEKKKIAKW